MGVGVCTFAIGEGSGEVRGVAAGFDPEFKGNAADTPLLLTAFEFEVVAGAELRAVDEFERLAEVLFAAAVKVLRLLAFEFLFAVKTGFLFEMETGFLFEMETGFLFEVETGFLFEVETGTSLLEFDAAVGRPPGRVNTTSN